MAFGFVLLASGSKGNACIVEHNGVKILIDCGTTKRYLMDGLGMLNLGFDDIQALLVTHHHSDHTRQIHQFKKQVYTPEPLESFHTHVTPYESFYVEHIRVFPIKTSHDAEISVGYVLEADKQRMVYITDTGYIKDSDLMYLTGADYIILESNHDPELLMQSNRPFHIKQRILSTTGHLSNDESGKILQKVVTSNTKEIVLAHLSEEANTLQLAEQTIRTYLHDYSHRLVAAEQFNYVYGGSYYDKE